MQKIIENTASDRAGGETRLGDQAGQGLSIRQKAGWGAGGFTENVMSNAIASWALLIYNIGLGVSPVMLGWAMFVPRALDAIIDPFLGNLSDNTRTRWGRRRPAIFIGAILSAVCFVAIWSPPLSLSKNGLLLYFLGASILYYISFGIFGVSYQALGLELTEDYRERTRVQAWRIFFITISSLLISWTYKLTFSPFFCGKGPYPGGKAEVIGIRSVSLILAASVLIFGLMPALLCKEKLAAMNQPKIRILDALRQTFTNRVYLIFIVCITISTFGIILAAPIGGYVGIYYVCQGNKEFNGLLGGYIGLIGMVVNFVCIPAITWVASRIGKRNTIFLGQVWIIAGCAINWFLFNPRYPYLCLLAVITAGPGLTTIMILYGSMLAEICDVDELQCGMRREGMYGAVSAFIGKVAFAATTVASGYILKWAGFNADYPAQSKETLFALRVMFVSIPAAMLVIGAILIWYFPITEQTARAVRAQIAARKAEAGAA